LIKFNIRMNDMKNTSTFLYSTQFPFFNAFLQHERISILNTQCSEFNNEFLQQRFAILCVSENILQTSYFVNKKLIDLPTGGNYTNLIHDKVNSQKATSLQPIQVFTATDYSRMKFLHSTFTYYKSMSDFNLTSCSYLN